MTNKTYYTQRDWDRTVGYGQVPYKYSLTAKIMEDKRAQKIMDNETSKLYSEHYGVDEYIDRYANVFKDMTYWRVDMYDKNDMSTPMRPVEPGSRDLRFVPKDAQVSSASCQSRSADYRAPCSR